MNPKIILLWTCVIFATTGVITLLGIVKIDTGFLIKLFISLMLENITINVKVFNNFFKTSSEKNWFATAKGNYFNEESGENDIAYINFYSTFIGKFKWYIS